MIDKCPKCRTIDFANCYSIKCPMRKQKGGKRKGAGRKPATYQTKTISFRIKTEWIEDIKLLVKSRLSELKNESND